MRVPISFVKMSGAGNDFVVISNMRRDLQCDRRPLAVALCAPHTGIGADGLLILSESTKADFMMEYYNADGSYGGMCGNGGRCAARFAFVAGIAPATMSFEALDYIYTAEVLDGSVRLHMKDPRDLRDDVDIVTEHGTFKGAYIDTGAPHFVFERTDVESAPLATWGPSIRYHERFAPAGCNVNVVKRRDDGTVQIRTYERGVEAETLACGTGCVAAAVVLAHREKLGSPVSLKVKSGEMVRVYFERAGEGFHDIVLEGSAHFLFQGQAEYDTERQMLIDVSNLLNFQKNKSD